MAKTAQITGKSIKIGEHEWLIRDNNAPIMHVDTLTEARERNGDVFLTLGQTVVDSGGPLEINIAVRLRLSHATAAALYNTIGDTLRAAQTAAAATPTKSRN